MNIRQIEVVKQNLREILESAAHPPASPTPNHVLMFEALYFLTRLERIAILRGRCVLCLVGLAAVFLGVIALRM